jgi:hypothetical protein
MSVDEDLSNGSHYSTLRVYDTVFTFSLLGGYYTICNVRCQLKFCSLATKKHPASLQTAELRRAGRKSTTDWHGFSRIFLDTDRHRLC